MNNISNIAELQQEKARLKLLLTQKEAQIKDQLELITDKAQPIINTLGYFGIGKKQDGIAGVINSAMQVGVPMLIGRLLYKNMGGVMLKTAIGYGVQWLLSKGFKNIDNNLLDKIKGLFKEEDSNTTTDKQA